MIALAGRTSESRDFKVLIWERIPYDHNMHVPESIAVVFAHLLANLRYHVRILASAGPLAGEAGRSVP